MENFIRYVAFIFVCFIEVSTECDDWITVSVDRTVHKEGFHREIVSNVSWFVDNTNINCSLLLVHYIPREMFVDLDEIKRQDLSNAKTVPLGDKSNFDVERPAHLSTDQNVLVYPNIEKQIKDRPAGSHWELTSSSILPVHWRYQQPTEDQYYATVSLPRLTVLARCQDKFTPEHMQECMNKLKSVQYPCNHDTVKICDWFVLKQMLTDKDNEIIFTIPVGIKKHTILVSCGTIFITLSASYILMQLPWLDVNKEKI